MKIESTPKDHLDPVELAGGAESVAQSIVKAVAKEDPSTMRKVKASGGPRNWVGSMTRDSLLGIFFMNRIAFETTIPVPEKSIKRWWMETNQTPRPSVGADSSRMPVEASMAIHFRMAVLDGICARPPDNQTEENKKRWVAIRARLKELGA